MGAILHTEFLPARLKRNLANGLDARWLELIRDRKAGYSEDNTAALREQLISDARQAHALGLIAYLPDWAR